MLAQYTGKLPLFVQKQFDLKAGLPDMTLAVCYGRKAPNQTNWI